MQTTFYVYFLFYKTNNQTNLIKIPNAERGTRNAERGTRNTEHGTFNAERLTH